MDSWKFRYSIFYRTLKGGLNWEYVNRLGETIEIFLLFSFSWPVPFFLIFRDAKSGGKNMRLQMCTTDRWCPTVTLCCWCRGFPKSTCYALLIFLGQLAIFLFLHLKYEKKKKKLLTRIGLGSIIQMDQVLLWCQGTGWTCSCESPSAQWDMMGDKRANK